MSIKELLKDLPDKLPLSQSFRDTALLHSYSLIRIPLIFFCTPKVLRLDDECCEIKIPLNRRTRNHWKTMYFGALAIGADCACGLLAFKKIQQSGRSVSFLFKDIKGDFLLRAEGDVVFFCKDGKLIDKMIAKTLTTGERVNEPMTIHATVPSQGAEPVATFQLTLSLKTR